MSDPKPDYSQYFDRLRSYTDWAGEPTVYIKDLVEAGFVYTGIKDLVFCFKCGVTIDNWKEDDNPIHRHGDVIKDCPFLAQRSRRIPEPDTPKTSTEITPVSYKSLFDYEKESIIYDWVPGKGTIRREDCEEEGSPNHYQTAEPPPHKSDIPEESISSRISSLGNQGMRFEAKRFESYALCPVNKHWPSPEQLSAAGFYYISKKEVMRCFCCDTTVDSWESSDQDPLRRHRALFPTCSFVMGTFCGNIRAGEEEFESERRLLENLNMNSNNNESMNYKGSRKECSNQPATPTQDTSIPLNPAFVSHRANPPNTQNNYVANPNNTHHYNSTNSSMLNNNINPMLQSKYSQQPPVTTQHYHQQHYHTTSPFTAPVQQNTPSTRQPSMQGTERYNTNHSGGSYGGTSLNDSGNFSTNTSYIQAETSKSVVYLSDKNKRLETFFTWPITANLGAVELADAGFVYTGKGDGVSCYMCKVFLKQWEPNDKAWSEHERWSPVCPLVIEKLRDHQHRYNNTPPPQQQQQQQQIQQQPQMTQETYSSLNETYLRRQQQQQQQQHQQLQQPRSFLVYGSSRSLPTNVNSSSCLYEKQQSYGETPVIRYPYMDEYISEKPLKQKDFRSSEYVSRRAEQRGDYYQPQESVDQTQSYEKNFRSTVSGRPEYNNVMPETKVGQSNQYSYTNNLPRENEHPCPSAVRKNTLEKDDLEKLFGMGFTEEVVLKTLNCYNEYAPKSFTSLDDLAQAVIYYQEYGHLEGTPFGRNLNVEPSKGGESMIYKPAESQPPVVRNIPNEVDHKNCKICMDNDVEVTFVPCGHLIVCESCALGRKECPICRMEIKETVRTYYFGN